MHSDGQQGADLPARLADELRRAHTPPFSVPPAVDEAILANARRQLAGQRRMRRLLYWSAAGISAAAAVFVVAFRLTLPAAAPTVQVARSQNVTILDAFELARQLRTGQTPDLRCDANHDGVVDQRDVDAIAQAAVSLKGGTL